MVLVDSKQKELPSPSRLTSCKMSTSTVHSVWLRHPKFIQREIEAQLFQISDVLLGIIHLPSQRWVKTEVEAHTWDKAPCRKALAIGHCVRTISLLPCTRVCRCRRPPPVLLSSNSISRPLIHDGRARFISVTSAPLKAAFSIQCPTTPSYPRLALYRIWNIQSYIWSSSGGSRCKDHICQLQEDKSLVLR